MESEKLTTVDSQLSVSGSPFHRMSEDCWKILDCLRFGNWKATSLELARVNPLNYRARISDLRRLFLLDPKAHSHRDPITGKLHTVYVIEEHQWARANWLWMHRTLEGYTMAERQRGMF